ncbi:ArgP/LysG family DNA-binding transcriptional regulator [Roseibacterium sp. SDUM158016]|uniref:ArgP/LysG family DNA-binding transcriptional regulator n=1 Tax=Roseicyclus sediminis TaxID=2980997 RepID=UPI0021D0E891|nr:ArgP/LysG family DNA-binding transcriptional regulator [Roseibacterium sp. SDUM158016]MCU4654240.1 ArgP/LysG family DNA-binding transcriptional regulator [Roseibacterium sp. SDUM158016]
MHLDLKQVEALAAVLRTGSFEAAAQHLNLTASALSQRVRLLEERVGAVLVVRAAPCRPTRQGRRIWQYAQDVAWREHDLLTGLALDVGPNRLTVAIAVSPDTMATWFMEALRGLPNYLFVLEVDNAEQGSRLLASGDVLAAVTWGQKVVQGCDGIPLGALQYMPVCSPAFHAEWFSDGLTPEVFSRAPSLAYNLHDRLQVRFATETSGSDIIPPSHLVADARALADAAEAGLGWVMLPHLMARPLVDDGRLVLMSEINHYYSDLTWQVSRATKGILQPLTRAVRETGARLLIQA